MPSLQELFKSKKLSNNQTAQQKYDIQNSKENKPTSANALMTAVAFPLQQIARRNLSAKGRETRFEEEITGLRILKNVASPIIYGTDIIRLKTRTTTNLDNMREAANGSNAGGVLSAFANKIKSSVSNFLGLPQSIIPTLVFNDTKNKLTKKGKFHIGFNRKDSSVWNTMTSLSEIKDDAAGSLLGKFLQQNAQGTPNQMGGQILGGGIQAAKSALTKKLFGSSAAGIADPLYKNTPTLYVKNKNKYGQLEFNSLTQDYSLFEYKHYATTNVFTYSNRVSPKSVEVGDRDDLSTILTNIETVFTQKLLPKKITKIKYQNDYTNTPYSKAKNEERGTVNEYGDYVANNSLGTKRGFTYNELMYDANGNATAMPGNYGDALNDLVAFSEEDELKQNDYTKNLDFIPLKFYSVAKKSLVVFRATLSGFSETLRPTWESNKFVGNPFNYYTYSGIERTATFKFKIYSLSAGEHIAAWQRIKFLTSLVYPAAYESAAKYVVPPFIKFTLGDLYHKKEGFIESLTYTIDDNYSWETGLNAISGDSKDGAIGQNVLKNYKLPMIIDVDISIKFVESAASHGSTVTVEDDKGKETKQYKSDINLYAFGKKADDAKKNIDGGGNAKTNTAAAQPKAKDGSKKENPVKQSNTKVDFSRESNLAAGMKDGSGKKEYILDGKKVSKEELETAAGIKKQ
jgi:hypothetical protein